MCGPVIAAPKDTSSRVMQPQNAPAAPQPSHMLQVTGQIDVVAGVAAPDLAKTLTGRLGVVIADIANPAVPARRSALQPATAWTLRGGRQQRAPPC
jgi:hypothetical protein